MDTEIINLKLEPSIFKYKYFYESNQLSSYDNKNVIYIGYIGYIENEHMFKFGITSDIYRRDFDEHKKNFDLFELIFVSETDNNSVIEAMFKKELKCKKNYRKLIIKDNNQTELFTITDIYPIEKIISILNNLIQEYKLPIIKQKELEIENLKIQISELKNFYQTEIQFYKELLKNCFKN